MDYLNKYNQIIESRPLRIKTLNDGYETHHIIPRSLGGKDTKENLVVLTPREHYICHLLLSKFTKGDDRSRMVHAVRRMAGRTARSYEVFRKGWMKSVSEESKKRWADPEYKNRLKSIHKNRIRTNKGAGAMARWDNPNASNEFKSWWKKNKIKMSESHKQAWQDPVKRQNRLDAIRKAQTDPALAKMRSERTRKAWETRKKLKAKVSR